ncbi:restriction endonuclease subunit S [Syntrophotalea acetylenica]|uniref:restriction endonuclease subunit S n=1 Tax=Syntrophotalea acetylenica TaxID=29542 RepID=UPI0009F8808F|nr:restriction endonuclease subunit S [Syntrophotalea acetylenica]
MNTENWIQTNLGDTEYFQPQSTGITSFTGTKDYLSTSSVDGNKITSIEEEITYRSRPSRANLQPQPNTAWFARMRETHKVLSTSQYLRDQAILSTGFCGIQAEQIDTVYLTQYLSSDFFERQKDRYAEGSTQIALSNIQLPFIKIQFPKSKPEQSKIAEVLSKVDQAIEQTESLIAKQQRIKTGLMQDLLTRGIDEHGNLRSEETHEFKDSPLGRIPVEWDIAPISKYGSRSRSYLRTGPFGSDLNTKHWVEYGTPVLTIGSLGGGLIIDSELLFVDEKTTDRLKGFSVEEGDIVFSRVADIGRSLVIDSERQGWIISSNLMRISLNEKLASPEFLYRNIAFNSKIVEQLRKTSNSGGRDLVNGPILNALLFPWPSIEEQIAINNRLQSADARFESIKGSVNKLRSLKTALMQDLLTGKKRVTPLLEKTEVHS